MKTKVSTISKIRKRVERIASTLSYADKGYLDHGVKCDADGSYRYVQFAGNVVYKILIDRNCPHNLYEWQLYQRAHKTLRAMMAQPLHISRCGSVLAMRRIPHLITEELEYDSDIVTYEPIIRFNEKLERELIKCGVSPGRIQGLITDNHPRNIGRTKTGKLKWIDYAGYTSFAQF
jgi:hypothetical protein